MLVWLFKITVWKKDGWQNKFWCIVKNIRWGSHIYIKSKLMGFDVSALIWGPLAWLGWDSGCRRYTIFLLVDFQVCSFPGKLTRMWERVQKPLGRCSTPQHFERCATWIGWSGRMLWLWLSQSVFDGTGIKIWMEVLGLYFALVFSNRSNLSALEKIWRIKYIKIKLSIFYKLYIDR